MAYSNVEVERFGPLDLLHDPAEVGFSGASDLLNVDFDQPGRVRTRDGYTQINGTTPAGFPLGMLGADIGGPDRLWIVRFNSPTWTLDRLATDTGTYTTAAATFGAGFSTPSDMAVVGLPASTSYLFIANNASAGGAGALLQRFDGTTLSNSLGHPRFLAVSPWGDNRLVQGWYSTTTTSPSGANGSASTVFFSNAGDPNTYDATDFVTLRPGDGEEIQQIVSWRELLFVFKETAMFVFYATSVDATGGAIFNYRKVDLPAAVPARVGESNHKLAVAGTDGVYFVTSRGIHRTAGGVPELISTPIDPIWLGTASASLAYEASAGYTVALAWAGERLYVSYSTVAATNRMLVWDRVGGTWTVWDVGLNRTSWTTYVGANNEFKLYFASSAANMDVFAFSQGTTTDDGVAITSYYQSGVAELAQGKEAHVRDFDLTGTGTVTHQIGTDFGAVDTGASVTLGTAPTPAVGFDTLDRMGRNMSFKVSAASGAWSLNRWMARVKGVRDWT